MSSYQLDSDVALPVTRTRYPFNSMKPGQSFAIVGEDASKAARNASYQHAKKANAARQGQIDAAVKEATEAGASAEDIAAVRAEMEANLGPEVEYSLRLIKTEEKATDKVDDQGNPVVETVKHYRLWRV